MEKLQVAIAILLASLVFAHKTDSVTKQELRTDEHRSRPSYARYDYMDPYASKAVNYNPVPSSEYESAIRPTFYPSRAKLHSIPVSKAYIKPDYEAQKPHHRAIVTSYFRQGYASDDKQMDYKTHYELPTHYPAYQPEYSRHVYNKPVVANLRKVRPPSYAEEFVPSPHFYPATDYIHSQPFFNDHRHRYDYAAGRNDRSQDAKGRSYEARASDSRYPLSIYGY